MTREEAERVARALVTVEYDPHWIVNRVMVAGRSPVSERSTLRANEAAERMRDAIVRALVGE